MCGLVLNLSTLETLQEPWVEDIQPSLSSLHSPSIKKHFELDIFSIKFKLQNHSVSQDKLSS